MKEFNLEEYNKMCAKFLGWEFQHGYYNPDHLHEYSFKTTEDLKFNSDWNWIMEVVDKIKTLPYEEVESQKYDDLSHLFITSSKKRVVNLIWHFLNWYKENKE
jgi:hypothetical protein